MGNRARFPINTHMLLNDILGGDIPHNTCTSDLLDHQVDLIRKHCGEFLYESRERPVYKSINQHTPFVKLKARKRKSSTNFSKVFNETFDTYTSNLRQRAVHAHGTVTENNNPQYYLFPTDGFRFIFNPQVINSSVYERMYNEVSDDQLISQLLVENYQNTNLPNAIKSGSEILFFNTPFCYAVNTQSVGCYDDLLTLIHCS